MHMHLVEFAIVIDVGPSLESPFDGLGFLAMLLVKALRCAVRDREYVANEAPAGIAAEIELPGFGKPAAVVRLDNPEFAAACAMIRLRKRVLSSGPSSKKCRISGVVKMFV